MCTDAPLPAEKIGLSPRFFLKGDGTVHRPGPIRLSRTTDGSVALAERIADLGTIARSGQELPVQQSNQNLFCKFFVLFWIGFCFFLLLFFFWLI